MSMPAPQPWPPEYPEPEPAPELALDACPLGDDDEPDARFDRWRERWP